MSLPEADRSCGAARSVETLHWITAIGVQLIAGTFSRLKPLMLRTVSEVVCIEVGVDKAALRLTILGQGF